MMLCKSEDTWDDVGLNNSVVKNYMNAIITQDEVAESDAPYGVIDIANQLINALWSDPKSLNHIPL